MLLIKIQYLCFDMPIYWLKIFIWHFSLVVKFKSGSLGNQAGDPFNIGDDCTRIVYRYRCIRSIRIESHTFQFKILWHDVLAKNHVSGSCLLHPVSCETSLVTVCEYLFFYTYLYYKEFSVIIFICCLHSCIYR